MPFRQPGSAELPEHAIRILAGESLCLSGSVADGEVGALRLADKDSPPLFSIHLGRNIEGNSLTLTNLTTVPLRVGVLVVRGRLNLAFAAAVIDIPPGKSTTRRFPGRTHRLLLARIRIIPPPPPEPPPVRRGVSHDPADRTWGMSFIALGGLRHLRLRDVNRSLASHGYSSTRTSLPQAGLEIEVQWKRFRFDLGFAGGGTTVRSRAGGELSVFHGDADLTVSWDFVRHHGFSSWLSSGPVLGSTSMDANAPGYAVFSERLAKVPDARVARESTGWGVGVGAEHLWQIWRGGTDLAIAFSYRLGHVWHLDSGDGWREVESGYGAGSSPDVDTSGWRAYIGVGLAAWDCPGGSYR